MKYISCEQAFAEVVFYISNKKGIKADAVIREMNETGLTSEFERLYFEDPTLTTAQYSKKLGVL